MNLKDLRLNATLMSSLYKRVLVAIPTAGPSGKTGPRPEEAAEAPDHGIRYLGNHRQRVTVLVNNPEHTFMPENHLALLTKILSACQMNMGDVAVVNVAAGPPTERIPALLGSRKVILFGTEPGKELTLFEPYPSGGIHYLAAPSLDELSSDTAEGKQLKARLWTGLKQLFGLA